MTRDEILKKSREENKGVDFADFEAAKNGIKCGWIVAITLSSIFCVIDGMILSRVPFEMLSALLMGLSTLFFVKYYSLRKKHELIIAVFYLASSLCFFVSWIIQIMR